MQENIVLRVEKHPLQTDAVSENTEVCEKCGETLEVGSWPFCPHEKREVGYLAVKSYPFVTRNFNGKPIEVTSAAHERALCQSYGVVKRDDVAWNLKTYEGYDHRTGKQVYKEGNGVGLPNCWV